MNYLVKVGINKSTACIVFFLNPSYPTNRNNAGYNLYGFHYKLKFAHVVN